MPAWKNTQTGIVTFGATPGRRSDRDLQIPCGKCMGCQKSKAQAWALRCLLELQEHHSATFTTLTYDEKHLPKTLSKRDLQLFLKRLRKRADRPIRFFASGEYGDTTGRPHYHAILYGLECNSDRVRIDNAWRQGHAYTVAITPAAIGYTAGYCAKKYNAEKGTDHERVDYETGEVYEWQSAFIQMSRNPGIGGKAREHAASWEDFAILNGTRIPVPEYLHKAWKETTTEQQLQEHNERQRLKSLTKERMTTLQLNAQEEIAKAQQKLQSARRRL